MKLDLMMVSFFTVVLLCSCTAVNQEPHAADEQMIASLMTVRPDKELYSSGEVMTITTTIVPNETIDDATLELAGVHARSRDYVQVTKKLSLTKGEAKEVVMTSALPSCNSCSGISPGKYSITATLRIGEKIIGKNSIDFELVQ